MVETTSESKPDPIQQFLRAARANNITRIEDLLSQGVDINSSNSNGLTALHLAAKEGHVDTVKLLLSRHIYVDAATKKGNTALHIASLAGQLLVTQLLVEAGANINVQSQNGFTPLYMAAQENHVELVSYLLANQAKQTIATQDGFTPLAVALQQGHDQVVALLLEKDSRTKVRLPALHIAAKKDDVNATVLLLNTETNIDQQSTSGFTPLHIASHYGNVNVAYLLIQNKADVNFQAKNNITPMHVAAKWGRVNMIQLLIEAGAIVDCKTRDGLTPMHCAARAGYAACVDLLLAAGADRSTRTKNGLSPLHMAVQGDHFEVANLLITRGANVNETTVDYLTPLHIAGHCGNVKVAHILLDNGCEVNARALNGFTPLHIACKKLKLRVVELLLDYGALIEATTETGLTPLHVASFVGGKDIVLLLIQKGANVNESTMRNETALHLAARNRQTDIVKVLLRNGALVDAKASENQTALHVATRTGFLEIVTILLNAGADINQMTRDNYTSLHIAAKEGFTEIAQALINHRADLEARTKKGFTPLHIAAKYGQDSMTSLLLRHNVDLNCSGRNGLTPLHVATHFSHRKVCDILLQAGADTHLDAKNGYTALHIAAKKNHLEIALMLLEHEAATDAESRSGFTPLHLAAQEGHLKMVVLLLRHQAPVNHKSKNGLTALHLTAQEDHVTVAELLEQSGAEVSPSTRAGYTPLHTASHFGQINMMRFLLGQGAQVNGQTHLGFTPLHLAAQQGHLQAVHVLLQNHADPNIKNEQGYTAAHIARKQHYLNIFEVLKRVTTIVESWEETIEEEIITLEKPERMGEHPMSDSDDEHGSTPSSRYDVSKNRKSHRKNQGLGDSSDSMFTSDSTLNKRKKRSKERILSNDSFYTSNNEDIWSQMEYTKSNLTKSRDTKSADTLKSGTTSGSLGDDSLHESTIQEPRDFSILDKSETFNEINDEFITTRSSNQFAANGIQSTDDWEFETDNVTTVERKPVLSGFLVSFLVDARGGIMQAQRQPDFRVLIPPQAATGPTRVTCRLMKPDRIYSPPALNDGDGLAAKIMEMGPRGLKFDSPILLEIPHFAALRENEREIIILRSDNGESWKEHRMDTTEQLVQETIGGSFKSLPTNEELQKKRIVRILTNDLPLYFALVTRIRHENSMVGADGAVLSSSTVSQVQAVFPREALQKKIKVGLQVLPVPVNLISKLVGNRVAMSPIITIEPRRRKFHKPITITLPIPSTQGKGMQNPGDTSTLRLLCSITGGSNLAVWEDITTNTPLKREKNCISFTTTVSARLWLVDCPMSVNPIELANHIYRECTLVPYIGRFHVYARRLVSEEAEIRCICTIDDNSERTLEAQEGFTLIASGPEVEVKNNRVHWLETAGNLIPVTKTGEQLQFGLSIFKENRLPFLMRIKDLSQEAVGKLAFMLDSRATLSQVATHVSGSNSSVNKPITLLELVLPHELLELEEMRKAKKKARNVAKSWGAKKADKKIVEEEELNLTDVAHAVSKDWRVLAEELGLDESTIEKLDEDDHQSMEDKCLNMINMWKREHKEAGADLALARALNAISRSDVVKLYFDEDRLLLQEEKQKNGDVKTDKTKHDNESDKRKSSSSSDSDHDDGDAHAPETTEEESSKPAVCPADVDTQPSEEANDNKQDLNLTPVEIKIQPVEVQDESATQPIEEQIQICPPAPEQEDDSLPGTFEYIEPCQKEDYFIEEKSGSSSSDEEEDERHKLQSSHEIIEGEPEEITKEEEFEEQLPDGSTLKHKVKETEISQTITSHSSQEICSDEPGNIEAELELRASQGDLTGTDDHQIIREKPEEVVETKETEEEQPDGTVVKKTITTKHVTQRTTEKIVDHHSDSDSTSSDEEDSKKDTSDHSDSEADKGSAKISSSSSSSSSSSDEDEEKKLAKMAPGEIQKEIIIEQDEYSTK